MFPIRRPCADAVRCGISVLWSSSSSAALYSSSGLYTGRLFIKQIQLGSSIGGSRNVFTSVASCGSNDNQLAKASNSSNSSQHTSTQINPSPPALNTVLRGSVATKASASSLSTAKNRNPILHVKPVNFAATPKEQEREKESDLQQRKNNQKQSAGNSGGSDADKPSLDELQKTYNILQKSLEKTFTHPMDYSIYNPDIVFIDNIRHIRTQGIAKYIQQVALLKTVGHVKFAYVRFEIINMSMSQEEARITVRWRIKGLSGLRVMLKFWKFKLWKWQEIMNHQETWYDGISYFDVGADGKIFQHVADKVMEDKDRSLDDKRAGGRNIPFAAKLGGALSASAFPTSSLSYDNGSHSSTTAGGNVRGDDGGGDANQRASAASASVVKSS